MTPAFSRALTLHAAHQPNKPIYQLSADEAATFRQLNLFRKSLTDDNWPEKVAAIRGLFGLPCPNSFGDISPTELELQRNLMREELEELEEAISFNDQVLMVDALLDTIYVALGFLFNLGLPPTLINLLMEEVHASNMTKVDSNGNPVINNKDAPKYDPSLPEGKVLKTDNYTKPDLTSVISKYYGEY